MRHRLSFVLAPVCALLATPAVAEVIAVSDRGFVSRNEATVPIPPEQAWTLMLRPTWWDPDHTYSGSSGNLFIDPVVGGCFCETIPGKTGGAIGQVEHMAVILTTPPSMFRMTGGLGPLQAEAVTGVLTITIETAPAGSTVVWEYIVGGYMRGSMIEMAPVVDGVMAEQLTRYARAAEG